MRGVTSRRRGGLSQGFRRAVAAVLLPLVAMLFHAAFAEASECATKAMYVVAHEDDSLLFQSPALLGDIHSDRCVRTVFLTAGDAGLEEGFWRARERGAEAAYAEMAGTADAWTESTEVANGHPIALATLSGDPRISLLFMRLPDGGYPAGQGTAPQFESLMKLWNGGNKGTPSEPEIETVAEAAPALYATHYDYEDLIETLAAVIDFYQPRWIATQNYTGSFPVGSEEPIDHPDHVATAKFVREAQSQYLAPHQLIGYEDYETEDREKNVFGLLLEEKGGAFEVYGEHDTSCDKGGFCEELYEGWLSRQYVAASETHGVVANAGYLQAVDAGEAVSLDGSLSSAEGDAPLGYEWRQLSGPAVELSGADTATPSFVAPPAAASLSFSLTVSDGVETSDADVVSIAVEGPDPTPTAVTGGAQTVESNALVELDGSASVNPYLQPLGYEWRQLSGPAVELSGADTAAPSFVAPSGPNSLEFSLVVSNAAGRSAPASVAIAVLPEPSVASRSLAPPPAIGRGQAFAPRLSRSHVRLAIPRRGRTRKVVSVRGEVDRVWCTGRLPRGARRRARGKRIAIEATPAARRAGRYRLHVHALVAGGAVTRPLVVRLIRGGPGH